MMVYNCSEYQQYKGGEIMKKLKDMNRWIRAVILGNMYCIIFWVISSLLGKHMVSTANGLFYSIGVFVIVGLIALLNPKRQMERSDKEIRKLTIKEVLTTADDMVSKGYRLFLYCFIISMIITVYSYVIYEIGARALGIS